MNLRYTFLHSMRNATRFFKLLTLVFAASLLIAIFWSKDHEAPVVVTDPETGCEYLQSWSGVISPRLNNLGQQKGCK